MQPRQTKVTFRNNEGYTLSGKIEWPAHRKPIAFALFAHCFACNKNLSAVRNIARAVTGEGIAIMRFDFTGIGESEGALDSKRFVHNVTDLLSACQYLEEHHEAPSILIGHSLGGAAVLLAAQQIDSVKAVVTIGAPSDPYHLTQLFSEELEAAGEDDKIHFELAGRSLALDQAFVRDLQNTSLLDVVKKLKKPILILHSPHDEVVSIEHAANLYHAAFHPKSFITLDGSDHLVSEKKDALYVGNMIAHWVYRYLGVDEKELPRTQKDVVVRLLKKDLYTCDIVAPPHHLLADEPSEVGGNDFGPTPYELLSASLGACTAMTLHMYAKRKKWDLEEVEVHLSHDKVYPTVEEESGNKIDQFDRSLVIKGNLDEDQKARLMEIADRCPVHRTLHNQVAIRTTLE